VLVHVIEWPWQEPPGPAFDEIPHEQSAALSEYRRYLEDRAAARLRSLVPEEVRAVTSCRVRHGKAHAQVLAAADAEHADMIVLGVHSRSRVDIGLLGSTANQVVRSASCPVLTVRA
jgi:nucleotide-binding universal stress UspA family protein